MPSTNFKLKIFWLNKETKREGHTVMEGSDANEMRNRFSKAYPTCSILKTKAVKS